MNLQEALDTANWLYKHALMDEMTPDEIMRVKTLRDLLFFMHAALGITEIRLEAFDQGILAQLDELEDNG